jgi:hypothetical protein
MLLKDLYQFFYEQNQEIPEWFENEYQNNSHRVSSSKYIKSYNNGYYKNNNNYQNNNNYNYQSNNYNSYNNYDNNQNEFNDFNNFHDLENQNSDYNNTNNSNQKELYSEKLKKVVKEEKSDDLQRPRFFNSLKEKEKDSFPSK